VIHIKNRTWKPTCGKMLTEPDYEWGRGHSLAQILDQVVPTLPRELEIVLPFGLHDGVQYVPGTTSTHPVLGTAYHRRFSPFAVPFALGCQRSPTGYVNTPVVGWDQYVKTWFTCNSTMPRIKKAVFRGKAMSHSMRYGTCINACDFKDNGRLYVHWLGEQRPDLFDTSVNNANEFNPELTVRPAEETYVSFPDQLCNYQAVLNIGNNMDWAERLRQSFYGNAVILQPEGAPSEFFNAFMLPWKHYWPVAGDLSNLTEQVEKVMELPEEHLDEMLQSQREFAQEYLSEHFQLYYNRVVIEEYFKRKQLFMFMKSRGVANYPPGYNLTKLAQVNFTHGEELVVSRDGAARTARITESSGDRVKLQFSDYNPKFDTWLYKTSDKIQSDENTTWGIGDHITMKKEGQWRDSVIIKKNNIGKVDVHFPEWDTKFDEWVPQSSQRFDSLGQAVTMLRITGCQRKDLMDYLKCPDPRFPNHTQPR